MSEVNEARTGVRNVLSLLAEAPHAQVDLLAGDANAAVADIRLVDDIEILGELAPATLAVLDRRASASSAAYTFDIAVRRAHNARLAGLVLVLPAEAVISFTARALCDKVGLALARVDARVDLMALLRVMAAQLTDEMRVTVERVAQANATITLADTDSMTVEELIDLGTRLLVRPLHLWTGPSRPPADFIGVPLNVLDDSVVEEEQRWIVARRWTDDPNTNALTEMLLWRLAVASTRVVLRTRRRRELSRHTAGEILLHLVESDGSGRSAAAPLAHRIGIPLDFWHIVTYVEFANLNDLADHHVDAFEIRDMLARTALEAAVRHPGTWHVAQDPTKLIVLFSSHREGTQRQVGDVRQVIEHVIEALRRASPELAVFAGVGTSHPGLGGLASSAQEARLAAGAARIRHRANHAVSFDSMGMRTTLVEWYNAPNVQDTIDALFAPLDDLPRSKQESLIATVSVYLDNNGSVARTAETLHLHRNAVRYRLQRAFEILRVDADDPDQRLFLHLACRGRRPALPTA